MIQQTTGITEAGVAVPSFRFKHFDLKGQRAGAAVEVTLSAVNNVRLMTGGNFQRFKELLDFKYVGGVAKKSPARLVVPEDGHWHLVVDAEGHNGLAECSVKVTPPMTSMQRKAG